MAEFRLSSKHGKPTVTVRISENERILSDEAEIVLKNNIDCCIKPDTSINGKIVFNIGCGIPLRKFLKKKTLLLKNSM